MCQRGTKLELSYLGISKKREDILNSKGICSIESLLFKMPKKYLDFSTVFPLDLDSELSSRINNKEPAAIIGICRSVENDYKPETKRSLIKMV